MSKQTASHHERFGVEWTRRRFRRGPALLAACLGAAGLLSAPVAASIKAAPTTPAKAGQYIIEAPTFANAVSVVKANHGKVVSNLAGINAVVARLSAPAVSALRRITGIEITPDQMLKVESISGSGVDAPAHAPSAVYPQVTGASPLVSQGTDGSGVGVAVLDTGIDKSLATFGSRVVDGVDLSGEGNAYQDSYGHGTFVAGLIAGSGAQGTTSSSNGNGNGNGNNGNGNGNGGSKNGNNNSTTPTTSSTGQYVGEAPGASLISIKVAGSAGVTSEGTVIAGILWAVVHKSQDNIRVLNISLGVVPPGPSGTDPVDLAVDLAWNSGIVVVSSAGNSGPINGTITSPGDDPLAITVGALDDGGGNVASNFTIPTFSSVGPTLYDGYFKPDLVAPGRSVISVTEPGSTVYNQNPSARIGADNFVGSGTSFSAAIVSGAAALILDAHSNLTPNQVKARLLGTATPGPAGNPFADGHGIPNALAAAKASNVDLNQSISLGSIISSFFPSSQVSLEKTWALSAWNPANWSGTEPNGVAWNGVAWNGVAWNGVAWNGVAWNGVAWNGAFPTGVAWNGLTWNGVAWNGVAWNGVAWNGVAWNGVAWNGVAWNGVAWNGVAWNNASWDGVAWNISTWN